MPLQGNLFPRRLSARGVPGLEPAIAAGVADSATAASNTLGKVCLPEPALLAAGFIGGPLIIGGLTPLRNASTLAAQDTHSGVIQIYRRVFAAGVRSGWVGMRAPMAPASLQFTLLGPGFHVASGIFGHAAPAVTAVALVESWLTYAPSTRNAQVAHNSSVGTSKQVPLRPLRLMGPGFEWLFLRSICANAGIRVLSGPITSTLERLSAKVSGEDKPPRGLKMVGDLLASMSCGALSMPFNQLYANQVTTAAAMRAGPVERLSMGLEFLKSQYLVRSASGQVRLSHAVIRDAALRSLYIGCVFTSFAAAERAALGFV